MTASTSHHGGWRQWSQALRQTLRTPRTELVVQEQLETPILAPCRGHVFEFRVFACFTWYTSDLSEAVLPAWVRRFSPLARLRLQRDAVEVARRFGPQECQLFSEELSRRLDGAAWRFIREQVELTCEVWCRVALDDALRETLQPLWQQRVEMEERHELDLRRAALARDLTETWSAIIEKLQEDPFSEPASALSDGKFAETFARWREGRREATDSLIKLLEQASWGYKRMGLYEYAKSFDAALKAFKKEHGLPDEDE
jgi:hypothetical protein